MVLWWRSVRRRGQSNSPLGAFRPTPPNYSAARGRRHYEINMTDGIANERQIDQLLLSEIVFPQQIGELRQWD